jgi:hypothetical protein
LICSEPWALLEVQESLVLAPLQEQEPFEEQEYTWLFISDTSLSGGYFFPINRSVPRIITDF